MGPAPLGSGAFPSLACQVLCAPPSPLAPILHPPAREAPAWSLRTEPQVAWALLSGCELKTRDAAPRPLRLSVGPSARTPRPAGGSRPTPGTSSVLNFTPGFIQNPLRGQEGRGLGGAGETTGSGQECIPTRRPGELGQGWPKGALRARRPLPSALVFPRETCSSPSLAPERLGGGGRGLEPQGPRCCPVGLPPCVLTRLLCWLLQGPHSPGAVVTLATKSPR